MAKYKVKFDGEFEDEVFDTEREADDYARFTVNSEAGLFLMEKR